MNKLERINYPLKQQPNGDYLWLNIFRISSESPGPNIHIQANVHGAELQGNVVIHRLMRWFLENPFNGTISFIPLANPAAVNQKSGMYTLGRYNPVTGNNWNRNYIDFMSKEEKETGFNLSSFVTKHLESTNEEIINSYKAELFKICDHYEKRNSSRGGFSEDGNFNLLLQKLASPADIVLDLHTGPIATRYIYSAEYQQESAKHFKFPHLLVIPNEFDGAMDEASFVPWHQLSLEFKKQGRDFKNHFQAYTIELGSEERISFSEAELDTRRILNYFMHMGVHDSKQEEIPAGPYKLCKLSDYRTYYAPKGGLYEFVFAPGQAFNKDQVIAKSLSFKPIQDASTLRDAISEVKATESGIVINHNTSGSVAQGQTLYQVMENSSEYQL